MILISSRDSFADLPPSILKKKIKEIDERNRFVKLDMDELTSKLQNIEDAKEWSLLFNKEDRGGYYSMKVPAKITEFLFRGSDRLLIITDYVAGPISFSRYSIDIYSFSFDYNKKLITVQINT